MIVVIGSPSGRQDGDDVRASGIAASVAIAAAARGRSVQLVGRIGDDPVADAVLRDLAVHGVGHVAILRDAANPTPIETSATASWTGPSTGRLGLEPEDVELALRYLTDFAVVAVVGGAGSILPVVERAASWGAASLVIVDEGRDAEPGAPTTGVPVVRLAPAPRETATAFTTRVGDDLVRLDADAEAVRSAR